MSVLPTRTSAEPAVLAVCLNDDKASEHLLLKVASEFAVWHDAGLLTGLHIITAGFDSRKEDVKEFIEQRFISILHGLPEDLDWQIHHISLHQEYIAGRPVRNNKSPQAKRVVAAALARKAAKLHATEIVVNQKDREDGKLDSSLAHYIIKYASMKVRVVGSRSTKEYAGLCKDASKVPLGNDAENDPEVQQWQVIPEDRTDVYSRYKWFKRGIHWVFGSGRKVEPLEESA
ncbi:hypothetical protein WJX73_001231 [Symbiochloris irregularis]|uniref:UspA domain-containing protein n=1 Tax=Symbiochloris irregularis TaxID=706552 RepID=A0AAW1NSY1_9CHLO